MTLWTVFAKQTPPTFSYLTSCLEKIGIFSVRRARCPSVTRRTIAYSGAAFESVGCERYWLSFLQERFHVRQLHRRSICWRTAIGGAARRLRRRHDAVHPA